MNGLMLGALFWGTQAELASGKAKVQAEAATRKATALAGRVRDLTERVEKLTIISMALWTFVKQATGLADKDLMDKFRQIDLLDGREDGRVAPDHEVAQCPKCGRAMSRRHARCLFCGERNLKDTVFKQIT